jgi:hypothetical protein
VILIPKNDLLFQLGAEAVLAAAFDYVEQRGATTQPTFIKA